MSTATDRAAAVPSSPEHNSGEGRAFVTTRGTEGQPPQGEAPEETIDGLRWALKGVIRARDSLSADVATLRQQLAQAQQERDAALDAWRVMKEMHGVEKEDANQWLVEEAKERKRAEAAEAQLAQAQQELEVERTSHTVYYKGTDEYKRRADAAEATVTALREVIAAFLEKWSVVGPAVNGVIMLQAARGYPYTGPNVSAELDALRSALAARPVAADPSA